LSLRLLPQSSMLARLKNLWAISRYTIQELKTPNPTVGYITTSTDTDLEYKQFNPAIIINQERTHPFDAYETTEQSPDDSAPRNG